MSPRYDSTRTVEAHAESIHRRDVRRQNARYGFRVGE